MEACGVGIASRPRAAPRGEGCGRPVDLDLTSDQELFLQTTTRFIEASCPLTAVRAARTPERDAGARVPQAGGRAGLVRHARPRGARWGPGIGQRGARRGPDRPGPRRRAPTRVRSSAPTWWPTPSSQEGNARTSRRKVLPRPAVGRRVGDLGGDRLRRRRRSRRRVSSARQRAGGYVLSGTKTLVQDAHRSAWMLVTAADRRRAGAVSGAGRHHRGDHHASSTAWT